MTASAFVHGVEDYYGPYPRPAVRTIVLEYLIAFRPEELDELFKYVILNYSGQYRYTPDVAILEVAKKAINATRAEKIGVRKRKVLSDPSDNEELIAFDAKAILQAIVNAKKGEA